MNNPRCDMKALVYTGPETLEYRDVPMPQTSVADTYLVQIKAVGICGSDMHGYLGHDARRPAPLILGHEAAGVITNGPRKGERVTINPLVTCGACRYCQSGRDNICPERQLISMPPREGAFAEYIAMPAANLISVPDHISFEQASTVEPIACGWHAVRLAKQAVQADAIQTAMVIGGGAIGVGAALSLIAQGITDVTLIEPNPIRRDFLQKNASYRVLAPDALPSDALYDLIVDGVGYAKTRETASAHIAAGGVIAHIGLGEALQGLDIRRFTLQEVTFIGTYTYNTQDFIDTATALFNGQLGDISWYETRPLSDGAAAFKDIRAGNTGAPKIILIPEHRGGKA